MVLIIANYSPLKKFLKSVQRPEVYFKGLNREGNCFA